MNTVQAHRGPDGRGTFEDAEAGVALSHVRLAILDLSSAAAQPMHSRDGRFVLVYNGEIYNFLELRVALKARGCGFVSTGDAEVLLLGLAEYGSEFVSRLNGIFAFALWDRQERELLLARDHLGVKPLYYAEPEPGTLLFASEIKALCAHPKLRREPDFAALQQHLAYCHASGARTAFKGVYRLQPGHLLRWRMDTRRAEIERYWRPPFSGSRNGDPRQAAEELRDLVRQAVARQLVSDVPVGSFLSGGLDSSFVTAAALEKTKEEFQGYTITYQKSDAVLDRAEEDAPHARNLARTLGLQLHEIELQPKVADLWPKLVYHLDEPIADPAAISSYLICTLARQKGTPVLLSGQGGDELFCGYPRYPVMHATRWADRLPSLVRRGIGRAAGLLPGAREGRAGALARRLRRAFCTLELPPEQRFLSLCANTPQDEIGRILSAEFRDALQGQSFMDGCLAHMESEGLAGLQRLQERDLSIYLPNHNLLYTDKTGMAVGLEARVPLLDIEIVNRVLSYPPDWQLAGGKTKVLFREAARGIVPEAIINRPKAGFGAPYRKWLRYDLAEMWNDLTSESAVKKRGWFDYRSLQDARRRSQTGQDDLYMLQWAVLTIELWARAFIDRCPAN